MPVYEFDSHQVTTETGAWIAPTALVIGQEHLKRHSSIWRGAVLREDYDSILIGEATSVQDNGVIHTDPGYSVIIGDRVTVGHNAVIHGCTRGDNCLIGISATILNGVEIGKKVLVGCNTLLTEKKDPWWRTSLGFTWSCCTRAIAGRVRRLTKIFFSLCSLGIRPQNRVSPSLSETMLK